MQIEQGFTILFQAVQAIADHPHGDGYQDVFCDWNGDKVQDCTAQNCIWMACREFVNAKTPGKP